MTAKQPPDSTHKQRLPYHKSMYSGSSTGSCPRSFGYTAPILGRADPDQGALLNLTCNLFQDAKVSSREQRELAAQPQSDTLP